MIGDTTGLTFTAKISVLYCEGEIEGPAAIELVWWQMDHGRKVISAASVGNCLLLSSLWRDTDGFSHMKIEALPIYMTNQDAIEYAKQVYKNSLKEEWHREGDQYVSEWHEDYSVEDMKVITGGDWRDPVDDKPADRLLTYDETYPIGATVDRATLLTFVFDVERAAREGWCYRWVVLEDSDPALYRRIA